MNFYHRRLCRSDQWRRKLETSILPFALEGVELGDDVLEVGPGPGLTTEFLKLTVPRLTAIEIDNKLAERLKSRMLGSNVTVVEGDATAMPFSDARFSGAVSFTMLHHVPSQVLQNRLLREVARVLKKGATFAGVDSLPSLSMRIIHIGDTLVPVDPSTFKFRLESAGFHEIVIQANRERFRFRATRR